MARDDACVASSPALGGVDNAWVRYWDESSTIAVLEFQVEQPAQATVGPSKEKEKKKKKGLCRLPASAYRVRTFWGSRFGCQCYSPGFRSAVGFAGVRQTGDTEFRQGFHEDWSW